MLHVIEGLGDEDDALAPITGLRSVERPCRPGVALAALRLPVEVNLAVCSEERAAAAGVTVALWALVAIEADRAVDAIADALALERSYIEIALDSAATEPPAADVLVARRSELAVYARGLREALPRRPRPSHRCLSLSVPTHVLLAWRLSATSACHTVEQWAAERLRCSRDAPIAWEASAAASGLPLGEWVAVQAARAASRRSTLAQSAPCGKPPSASKSA